MPGDSTTWLAIAGMAAATYLTRAGGFWLMRWLPAGGRVEIWLRHLPGAVLAALVAPAVVAAPPEHLAAFIVTAALMAWLGRDFVAVAAGIAIVAGLRATGL